METANENKPQSYEFVKFAIDCLKNDKGASAAFRRADNPSTEYQSWEYFARYDVTLKWSNQRLPFGLIAAAIIKGKIDQNGSLKIGEAIAQCYDEGSQSNQAKAKLRRLLACDSVEEVCLILRPLLRLIEAKCEGVLDYARLLDQILWFELSPQKTKVEWAQSFYRSK